MSREVKARQVGEHKTHDIPSGSALGFELTLLSLSLSRAVLGFKAAVKMRGLEDTFGAARPHVARPAGRPHPINH